MSAWSKVKLSEVLSQYCEYIDAPESKEYKKLSVKLYGKGVVLDAPVDGSMLKMKRHQIAKAGQVILSEIWGKKGAIGFVPQEGEGALCTSHFFLFNINTEKLDERWLKAIFDANYLESQLDADAKGTTGYAAVRPKTLLACEIPLPPLAEQRRVVSRIEELSAQIREARTLQEEINSDLDAMLAALHRALAVNAPRKPLIKVAPLNRRPVTVDVNQTYETVAVRSFGRGTFHKVPLVGSEVTWEKPYLVRPGDILISNIKAWEGAIAVAGKSDGGRVASHRYLTCVPISGVATARFACFHLLSPEGLHEVSEASPGSADRNRTLSAKALLRIPIPIPSYSDQTHFDRVYTEVDALKRLQAETAAGLDALLPAILDRAFSGQLLPQESTSVRTKPRSAIVAQKYFIQLIPALLREIKRPITLSRLNAAISLLFLPDQLIPLIESAAGKQAVDHFKAFSQPNEAGIFKAALERLIEAGTITPSQPKADDSPTLRLNLSNLPPIASDIAMDAHYLATIFNLVPASTPAASGIPARKSQLKQQTSFV